MPNRSEKVRVVAKATGKEQVVPARWLDNPVIAAGFEAPKSTRKASSAEVPAEAKSTPKEK